MIAIIHDCYANDDTHFADLSNGANKSELNKDGETKTQTNKILVFQCDTRY
jgi:hypothetical protein